MSDATILIIDDEAPIRRVIRNALTSPETRIVEAASAVQGVDLAAAEQPSLIVLDLGLPDGDGLHVCRELRAFTAVPIIVLSARHLEAEKVALLDAGADDYVTKPFGTAEFVARVRAQLRRFEKRAGSSNIVTAGRIAVHLARRVVTRDGEELHLTPTEWELLKTFVSNADRTLTHQQLFQSVWGNASGDAQQYLRVYVGQLRRKIEDDPIRPKLIVTEPAVGYRWVSSR